jgi:hypothetical protein
MFFRRIGALRANLADDLHVRKQKSLTLLLDRVATRFCEVYYDNRKISEDSPKSGRHPSRNPRA